MIYEKHEIQKKMLELSEKSEIQERWIKKKIDEKSEVKKWVRISEIIIIIIIKRRMKK